LINISTNNLMEIQKTKDYSIFKFVLSNREVDANHVKKLARSIETRNLLSVRPIIVNDQMQLIDGQHRLEAAKQIGAEVFYIQIGNLTKSDIAVLNTAQKNWTRTDFINFYALEGNENYKRIAALLNKYYFVKPTVIIHMACGRDPGIKEGAARIEDAKRVEQALGWLKSLMADYPFITSTACACAFFDVVTSEKLFNYLKRYATPKTLRICTNYASYKEMFLKLLK